MGLVRFVCGNSSPPESEQDRKAQTGAQSGQVQMTPFLLAHISGNFIRLSQAHLTLRHGSVSH